MRSMLLLALILSGLAAPPASAKPGFAAKKPTVDINMVLGQRYFARGATYYAAGDYARALDAFEVAQRFKPAPALYFNTGRCHDRLEQAAEAIADYERFLAEVPGTGDAAAVRARISELRVRRTAKPPR